MTSLNRSPSFSSGRSASQLTFDFPRERFAVSQAADLAAKPHGGSRAKPTPTVLTRDHVYVRGNVLAVILDAQIGTLGG